MEEESLPTVIKGEEEIERLTDKYIAIAGFNRFFNRGHVGAERYAAREYDGGARQESAWRPVTGPVDR